MLRYLTLVEPAPLAAALAAAVDALARAQPGRDVLLAQLAVGRTERAHAHVLDTAVDPQVAARYHAWTGDLHAVAAAWPHIRPRLLLLAHAGANAAACAELERMATDIGDVRLAAELHRCARHADQAARAVDDADAATVLRIVHTIIGAEPDAARIRLRLRPRLFTRAQRLCARDIAFAGGSVRLDITRDRAGLTCRVAQDTGAVPFTVLLEPYVDTAVGATRVDGRAAQLDVRTVDDGTIVPVQLVLEEERTLEIELGE